MVKARMWLAVVTVLATVAAGSPAVAGVAQDTVGVVDQTTGVWYLWDAARRAVWLPSVAVLAQAHPNLIGLRVHDLRHTAARLAISVGGNIKAIQRMLGHRTASITLDRYRHLYEEDLITLADRMERKLRGAA